MTEVRQGASVTLTSQWYAYVGGPAADVTGLTITVTPAAGGTAVLGPTSTGVAHLATGVYAYTWTVDAAQAAGPYVALWAATGGLAASEVVTVLATPVAGAYASVDELTDYPVTVPSGVNAAQLLVRASREVDRALLTAVYDVDDAGLPTDAAVAAALRDAVCEQVAGNLDSGDRTGTGATVPSTGFTIGKISVQKQGAAGAGQTARIAGLWPQAYAILQRAGLTGQAVQVW